MTSRTDGESVGHDEAVNADAKPAGRRHALLQGLKEFLVHTASLVIPCCFFSA